MSNPTKQAIVTDEQAEAIFQVLVSLGENPEDDYGFLSHVKNPESYFAGTFEWTLRHLGIRLLVRQTPLRDRMREAVVYDHGYTNVTEKQFAEANERLAQVFAS